MIPSDPGRAWRSLDLSSASNTIDPITKTNWEGTGLEVDNQVPADPALDRSLELVFHVRCKK